MQDESPRPLFASLTSREMTFVQKSSRSVFLSEHDLLGKPVPTFPDHALLLSEHDPFGKPVPTFPDHALLLSEHDLLGKPVPTFPDHALDAERAAQNLATPESVLPIVALWPEGH